MVDVGVLLLAGAKALSRRDPIVVDWRQEEDKEKFLAGASIIKVKK